MSRRLAAVEWVTAGAMVFPRAIEWAAPPGNRIVWASHPTGADTTTWYFWTIANVIIRGEMRTGQQFVHTHAYLPKLVKCIIKPNRTYCNKTNNGCKCVISLGGNVAVGWRSSSGRSPGNDSIPPGNWLNSPGGRGGAPGGRAAAAAAPRRRGTTEYAPK